MQRLISIVLIFFCLIPCAAAAERDYLFSLTSSEGHGGSSQWKMKKADEAKAGGEHISLQGFSTDDWMPAIVPGTVLNSLVHNGIYPEPYYGARPAEISTPTGSERSSEASQKERTKEFGCRPTESTTGPNSG